MPAVAVMTALALGAGGLAAISAVRERRRTIRTKAEIFDGCLSLFDGASVRAAPDGYSRLSGLFAGRHAVLSLVPDTMTIKRLPQLWLSITITTRAMTPKLSILARPRGDDFFASTFQRRLPVPSWLPSDITMHGDDSRSEEFAEALRPWLERSFEDPRLKELTLGRGAMRAIYQLAQGDRGAHLLLRQSRFAGRLEPGTCTALCAMLTSLDDAAASLTLSVPA